MVDTNELLRQRAKRLVARGVSQKVLAAKMGMPPSSLSKWLHAKEGIGPATVTALDGFNAYVRELADAIGVKSEPGRARVADRRSGIERRHTRGKYKGRDRRSGPDRRRVTAS